jgi:hypothetical protein
MKARTIRPKLNLLGFYGFFTGLAGATGALALRLRIWGSGVRIPPSAPMKSVDYEERKAMVAARR